MKLPTQLSAGQLSALLQQQEQSTPAEPAKPSGSILDQMRGQAAQSAESAPAVAPPAAAPPRSTVPDGEVILGLRLNEHDSRIDVEGASLGIEVAGSPALAAEFILAPLGM